MNQELQTAINTIKQNKDKKIWQRKDYLPLVEAFPSKPNENENYLDVGGPLDMDIEQLNIRDLVSIQISLK